MKEIPQQEFRQVRFEQWHHDHFVIFYKVQQKFLVPSGEPYWACEKRNNSDLVIDSNLASTKWQPMKIEWKYLPEINED